MPFLENTSYNHQVPFLHKNAHFSTIYAGKFKKFKVPNYSRDIIELFDGDFLAIDFQIRNTKKAVILCHGLEGNSQRTYINSCATLFLENDYSVFAWNNRTCSGKMNRLPKMYHHASIEDLDAVVKFTLSKGFEEVYLIGFSMGGAQVLNYFGRINEIDSRVKAGVSVSVPIEIKASADSLKKGFNKVRIDGAILDITPKMQVDRYKIHDIEIVVDRLIVDEKDQKRLVDSIQTAMRLGKGIIKISDKDNNVAHFSKFLMCPTTGISYDEPQPNSFSFNSPYGACPNSVLTMMRRPAIASARSAPAPRAPRRSPTTASRWPEGPGSRRCRGSG